MPKPISELFKEIASQATERDEPVLALVCRMAALEAVHVDLSLDWNWDDADEPALFTAIPNEAPPTTLSEAIAKPYQVWTRSGTGNFSVIVPNAKAALAMVVQLSDGNHASILIKDVDGKQIELEVIKAMVEMETSPSFRLVPH